MEEIREVLLRRRSELLGSYASIQDVERLERVLSGSPFALWPNLFRELPVAGLDVAFVTNENHVAFTPTEQFRTAYDPNREHEFYWMSPSHVAEYLQDAHIGSTVLAGGFLPLGMCVMGGDYYFIRVGKPEDRQTELYRLFPDWILPRDAVPISSEAIELISPDFLQVLEVARFERGL